ncbi:MAG: hypothetical protein LBS44_07015, partial [Deltaproteobacteria bacterium]|nr:hypothetical protein [Deltaproteobacteria bacterium]
QDYIFIGHKYLNALLLRYQFKRGFGTNQDKEEILAVAKNILDIWVEAAPDIPTQKKEIRKVYEEIFGFYWMFLAMFHAQDEMLQLTKYYEEAMMACPDCGKSIPKIAPICRYCIQPLTGMAKSLLKEADQEFGTSPSHRTTQVDFHQKSDWEDQSSYVQEYGVRVRKSCATRIFNVLVFMICTALFIFFLKTGYYDDIKTESNEFSLWSKRYQLVGTLVPLLGFACLFSEILDVILFFYYRRFKRYGGWK